jgi:hypothetical protein
MKKLRDLGSRKNRNILKLEIDEIMADNIMKENGQLSVLKTLNFLSPRPSFFTVPIGEESINPFFRLLDSPNRSTKVPQGNS